MRSKFEIQMGEIHKELVQLGSLVESALAAALLALTEGDEVCVEQ